MAPDWGDAHFTLGRAHMSNGSIELATMEFAKTLELEPDHVDAAEELKTAKQHLERRMRRREHKQCTSNAELEQRWRRKISEAKLRRRPQWSDADWTYHGFSKIDLVGMFHQTLDNVARIQIEGLSTVQF